MHTKQRTIYPTKYGQDSQSVSQSARMSHRSGSNDKNAGLNVLNKPGSQLEDCMLSRKFELIIIVASEVRCLLRAGDSCLFFLRQSTMNGHL